MEHLHSRISYIRMLFLSTFCHYNIYKKSYEYIDMLSTKIRFEQREHLFLVDLLEEDSRRAENLVLYDLDWGNSR